jgi:hypothetical protein
LEEFAPEIVYIKGIHSTVADAISQLDYITKVNLTSEFNYSTIGIPAKRANHSKMEDFLKTLALLQRKQPRYQNTRMQPKQVFANHSEEEEIFPCTTPEIAEAQKANVKLKHCFKRNAVLD